MQSQKISILLRDWNFLGVGGSVRPKDLKNCMKLNWNFQQGGGLGKNPFHGEGTCMNVSGITQWTTKSGPINNIASKVFLNKENDWVFPRK